MEVTYPITIILDKYGGKYSGGVWTAWNRHPKKIPSKVFDNEDKCRTFWKNNKIYKRHIVGVGNTPTEAYVNLINNTIKYRNRKKKKNVEE